MNDLIPENRSPSVLWVTCIRCGWTCGSVPYGGRVQDVMKLTSYRPPSAFLRADGVIVPRVSPLCWLHHDCRGAFEMGPNSVRLTTAVLSLVQLGLTPRMIRPPYGTRPENYRVKTPPMSRHVWEKSAPFIPPPEMWNAWARQHEELWPRDDLFTPLM